MFFLQIININDTKPHPRAGNARWVNVYDLSYELYNHVMHNYSL